MTRTSTVPSAGCGRTSHHRNVGSGNAPQRRSTSTVCDPVLVGGEAARDARSAGTRRTPTCASRPGPVVAALPERRVGREREQQRQVGAQAVEQPGSRARRRARRRGRAARTSARGARGRAIVPLDDLVAARRATRASRCHSADGCVPGAPRPRGPSSAQLGRRAERAGRASCAIAPATVACGSVASSIAAWCVSALTCAASPSRAGAAGRRRCAAASDQSLGVEEHDLLLDADRVRPDGCHAAQSAPAASRCSAGAPMCPCAPPFCEELTTSAPASQRHAGQPTGRDAVLHVASRTRTAAGRRGAARGGRRRRRSGGIESATSALRDVAARVRADALAHAARVVRSSACAQTTTPVAAVPEPRLDDVPAKVGQDAPRDASALAEVERRHGGDERLLAEVEADHLLARRRGRACRRRRRSRTR